MKSGNAAPLLVAAMLCVVGFFHFDPFDNLRALAGEKVTACDGTTVQLDGARAELLRLHNEERAEVGAPALCVHPRLQASAQGHAEDMLRRGFYAHETPEGVDPGDRISRAGYRFATYGENNNWARSDTATEPGRREIRDAVDGWMGSPGHRKNLLNPAFREVGFGIDAGRYTSGFGTSTMYVVNFGARR